MNNQIKTVTGISAVGFLLLLWHVAELTNAVTGTNNNNTENTFKNAPVNIIAKDSSGNTDTMSMENIFSNSIKIQFLNDFC